MTELIRQGEVFTRWTALEDQAPGRDRVMCRCVCGAEREVLLRSLRAGTSRSCGCTRRRGRADRPAARRPMPSGEQLLLWYLKEGQTQGEIAARLGVHRRTVIRHLRAAGALAQERRTPVKVDRETLLSWYEQGGLSLAEVGARLGVCGETARRHLIRAGARIRKPGSPVRRARATHLP